MKLKSLILALTTVGAMAMPLLYGAPAQAQATRTWVSGVGDDANPCSRTAPCKTFAGAISKTAPGGEIDALDPGGFGALTITKSITIDGGGGQVASVLVAGTNGFVISAGATDVVIIKNIRLQGLLGGGNANAGTNAIRFINGLKLIVENCEIYGFLNNGIDIANPTASNFTAINNTQIMNVGNAGILVESSVSSSVQVDNARIYGSKLGVANTNGNKMFLSHSTSSNASNAGVEADPGATLILDSNVISFNVTGISGGGTIQSWNNNSLFGNGSNGVTPSFISGTVTNPMGMDGR
jgi:hypothetical protein